ncbi:hypothetical protein DXG01_006902 [Tephrocybe rancida]|nr:hypothetical protein DXG01_006902 [Tephrocybe rancida]
MAQPVDNDKVDSERAREPGVESDQWISILENTTSAPWLFSSIPGAEQKLVLAYTLLFQIVLYLSRPEGGEQFLTAFGTAAASPTSEIGRARVAVPVILRAAVHHMSTVPQNAPVRTEHSDIFDIFGAMQTIHDMYLTESIPDLETWTAFWSRVQPVVIELGMKLDEKGFGLPKDDAEGQAGTSE